MTGAANLGSVVQNVYWKRLTQSFLAYSFVRRPPLVREHFDRLLVCILHGNSLDLIRHFSEAPPSGTRFDHLRQVRLL